MKVKKIIRIPNKPAVFAREKKDEIKQHNNMRDMAKQKKQKTSRMIFEYSKTGAKTKPQPIQIAKNSIVQINNQDQTNAKSLRP